MSGSKGLQRYVPRILQDSGMIASSEVAHYTHLKLVQYVKADDIDAALRRAKAEGMREASDMVEDDCYALSESDVSDPTHAAKVLHNVNQQALSNKIDACAAQIEEGE